MTSVTADIVRELAPTGRLRTTINLGNIVLAQRHEATGELGGVSVDLARELGRRLSVEVELHAFDTAADAFSALQSHKCDLGFLAIDPKRAESLDFTPPYVIIEGTYLVSETSPLRTIEDVDKKNIRIATGENTAYDLHLSRTLRNAELVRYATSAADIEAFFAGQTDVAAGVRQPLVIAAKSRPGFRVMDGRFMKIEQAMTLPKGRPAAYAFLRAFIEDMKASGFVAAALERSGQSEATVAGPGGP